MQPVEWKLQQFNVRAQYLDESRFLKWIRARGNKQPDIQKLCSGTWLAYDGLDREDVDSFVLNLRVLLQDRDGFSIRCLAAVYDNFPSEFAQAKDLFKGVRDGLSAYLRQPSLVGIGGNKFTKHEILDIILYGGFAHNTPDLYGKFVSISKSGFFCLFSFVEFMNIITVLNGHIQQIAIINNEVISWLKERSIKFEVHN